MSSTISLSLPLPHPAGHTVIQQDKFKFNKRSLSRSWKQLSRFQRSFISMLVCVVLLTTLYYYVTKSEPRTHNVNIDTHNAKEKKNKVNFLPHLDVDSNGEGGKSRNKVESVHEVLKAPVEEGQDEAKEDEYRDEDDDEQQDGEERQLGRDNGDSNQARESFVDESVPPKDNSIKFKGPQNERQRAVVAAFQHAWKGYRTHAWGHDHLKPISKSAQNWFGLGLTIIDALDTMYIMNMEEEFDRARDWVRDKLDFAINRDVNLFETTIRILGGLLSTFHLSGDRMFLNKAKDLGDRLLGAFTSPSGIPYSDVNLRSTKGHAPKWSVDSSTSEVSTIQLEFRDLSRCTGDSQYEDKAETVSRILHQEPKSDGLVPIFINANTGKFRTQSTITLGARGDSYYEYLLKQWLQTGKTQDYLKDDFVEAIDGVNKRLVKRTVPNNLVYIGEILAGGKTFKPKMDELVCFLPGTLALGVHNGLPKSHMTLAEELAYTCYLTFARQPTFLAAEINYFNSEPGSTADFYVKSNDAHYLLRPETIEGLWYLYYFTGNKTYQDWGWNIFQGIEKYTKVSAGYTTIGNVRNVVDTRAKDMMESFLLAETFKYLYLLFADEQEINLDQWVFNTEAHPLPIRPN